MDNDPRTDGALMPGTPAGVSPPNETLLSLHAITKTFGAVTALRDVSLDIRRGRITALLGENGAGKTTLMRIAFGMIQPDNGWIEVGGARVALRSPANAIARGVGMVHQQFSLIPAMTVAENVAIGGRGRYSPNETARRIQEIGRQTGLVLDPERTVADLSNAERQKLEIVRTFAHGARIMILDEPTAVLTPGDVAELFGQLRRFSDSGGAAVLITHKLADVMAHADDVAVLRHGRLILQSSMNEAHESLLATAMLGIAPERPRARAPETSRSTVPVAALERVVLQDRKATADHIDLEIRRGEIVGIAALEGAAAPLLRVLAGRNKPLSGSVLLPDRIGFVPENRQDEAIIDDFSLTENFALAGAGVRRGRIDWAGIQEEASVVLERFHVKAENTNTRPRQLSGGNQQRFVLGRELIQDPPLLVLENPTQGLDMNAAAFVHEQIRAAAENGSGVVLYSSDLDELAQLADRVLVITPGGSVAAKVDRHDIGLALIGAARST